MLNKYIRNNETRCRNNPNYRQVEDTNYYVNRYGEFYREWKDFDRQVFPYSNTNHICIKIHGKKRNATRIMWEAFNGKIPDGYRIIHKNKIRTDMRLDNLKMVTARESSIIAAKQNHKMVLDMNTRKVYRNAEECGKAIGYIGHNVALACNGKYNAKKTYLNVRYITEDEAHEMRGIL